MEKEKEFVKPSLDLEVRAEVKGIAKLEDNMKEVKEMAVAIKEYYENTPFIEPGTKIDFEDKEQLELIESKKKTAKEEKIKVNKFEAEIDNKTKEVVEKYMTPINTFIELSKETRAIVKETYTFINNQVLEVDNQLKDAKEKQIKELFEEYRESKNIDFVTYADAKINVTLSASMKSLKDSARGFIDKIVDDLKLIDTQEHKVEILAEYRQSLNVAGAITSVTDRFKRIEAEKQRQEELARKKEEEAKTIEKVETVVQAPKISTPVSSVSSPSNVNTVNVTKKVILEVEVNKEQFTKVTEFLKEEGIVYEWKR